MTLSLDVHPIRLFCFRDQQVFVRVGLHSGALDTPNAAAWRNGKVAGGKTILGCLSCKVSREQLGNEKYDFGGGNARTNDDVLKGLQFVRAWATAVEQATRSRDRGVVVPSAPNPVRDLTFDVVRQNGLDVFHADALVK